MNHCENLLVICFLLEIFTDGSRVEGEEREGGESKLLVQRFYLSVNKEHNERLRNKLSYSGRMD